MDQFCGSPLWLHNLTWNITRQPDFTPCFQETILIWIPCIFILAYTPIHLVSVYKSHRRYIPVTLLNIFKAFLTTVLCLLSLAELIEVLTGPVGQEGPPLVDSITPIIKSITYVVVFGLIMIHRNRGVHTSGTLLVFWSLMFIASVINFRSLLLSALADQTDNSISIADWSRVSELRFTLRIVSTPIVVVQLVLSCIADKKAQDPFILTGEDYRAISPENDASILSIMTFWWLNSLMWLGYQRPLTQEDLFVMRPSHKTETVTQDFDNLLLPAIQRALDEERDNQPDLDLNLLDKPLNRESNARSSWIPLVRKRHNTRRPATEGDAANNRKNGNGKSDPDVADNPAKHVGIASVIFKAFWPSILMTSILKLFSSLLTFTGPILLSAIIEFITSQEPDWRGIVYATLLFSLSIIESWITNREQYLVNLNVMRIRTCITSALYRKTLRLSYQGRKHYTTGQIVNFMSVDSQRVADLFQNMSNLWSGPLQLTISMILLYQQLGVAIFVGLGVMLINIPFNAWIAVKLRDLQQLVMRHKDKRIKFLSEIFNGIKIIKIHAWEEHFKKRTEDIRSKEITSLTKQTWYSAAITFAFTCLPFVVSLASFATFILLDPNNILDAKRVFVSLSLFNIIRIPLAILPMLISNLSMFLVSARRINRFLESEEIDPEATQQIDEDGSAIRIKGGTFNWERSGQPVLRNIEVEVPKRKLVAIVGPVGSGKSSILSAILGDLVKTSGEVLVDKQSSMAYVPQEAWILNTTLKNNIMFNKVINEERYQRVIDACALRPDLRILGLGDQSEIGEKGINLSGGQRQRVSLARAVYADTDIYLLDDPLNAVDAHVGRHIFDNIIGPRGLLKDRTRLLVTNKLSILPEVDHIIVISDGQVSESGSYEQLLKNRGVFSQLLVRYVLENADGNTNVSESARANLITRELKRLEEKQAQEALEAAASINDSPTSQADRSKLDSDASSKLPPKDMHQSRIADSSGPGGELTGREVTQVGSVGLGVHLNFVRTMGINFAIALGIYIMSSAFTLSSNIWLSDWSDDSLNATLAKDNQHRNMRLSVYAGLGLGESVCVIVSTILLNLACLRGSHILHNRMLGRVLQAPLAWFNTTPSGRIINRFSKDIDTVDVTIRFNVRLLMVIALRSVTSLILISVGSVYSIMLIVPIVLLYFLFQIFYVSTSRQLKRIESNTRSPIYSHFTETITGTSSIRAFGVCHEFILESNHRVDTNNSSFYISFVSARWLAIRLDFLGFVVVLAASLIAVLSKGSISPGLAGLSVTYSLTVTTVLSFLVRTYSDYETNVVSVERLLEYTKIPIEPDQEEEPTDPDWPSRGEIIIDKFSSRYRPELDLVLRNFSLNVQPTEKVGLVGRTGAGKSSVTLALFRVLEAAPDDGGRIIIDDVDISHINLRLLRSKLSIIPQEPIMFTGTVRQNVDPTETYADDEIWRSLELSCLATFLRSLPDGLDHQVSEGGANFSVGQKQLFCLARTLLRRSKILVLDEATAAVDVETDSLIQETVRREFKKSTIVTIAHRLETIQDYDKVVVMENGQLAEEGPPMELMKRNNSRYQKLAREAGLIK